MRPYLEINSTLLNGTYFQVFVNAIKHIHSHTFFSGSHRDSAISLHSNLRGCECLPFNFTWLAIYGTCVVSVYSNASSQQTWLIHWKKGHVKLYSGFSEGVLKYSSKKAVQKEVFRGHSLHGDETHMVQCCAESPSCSNTMRSKSAEKRSKMSSEKCFLWKRPALNLWNLVTSLQNEKQVIHAHKVPYPNRQERMIRFYPLIS